MSDEEKWTNHIKEYCHSGDRENNHLEADKALVLFLRSLGFSKITEAYEEVDKWYT